MMGNNCSDFLKKYLSGCFMDNGLLGMGWHGIIKADKTKVVSARDGEQLSQGSSRERI